MNKSRKIKFRKLNSAPPDAPGIGTIAMNIIIIIFICVTSSQDGVKFKANKIKYGIE